jgi:signal transduction histidine kinase
MRLSFRHRVFLGLLALGTLPLAAALLGLALQVRSADPSTGARAAIDDIAESGRQLLAVVDTTQLNDEVRIALEAHTETLASRTTMARRAEVLSRYAAAAAGLVALALAVAVVVVSVTLARRWSAYVSAPIEELTAWVRSIEQRDVLPEHPEGRGAPEFDALRQALRDMSAALDRIRLQEIEQERLQAFRDTARQVAHEMRGPLTSARLAVGQLSPLAVASEKGSVALEVLKDETRRLEQLAQEFSDFGRLPEGPSAPIDVREMLEGVISSSVPAGCPVQSEISPDLTIVGHFEPMRRAIQNLLRNAVEVSESDGVEVLAERREDETGAFVRIEIADHGPGVPLEMRDRIFEPYFTTKELGTGLGLAIVQQTVNAHGGSVSISETDGGGANFIMTLPESSWLVASSSLTTNRIFGGCCVPCSRSRSTR